MALPCSKSCHSLLPLWTAFAMGLLGQPCTSCLKGTSFPSFLSSKYLCCLDQNMFRDKPKKKRCNRDATFLLSGHKRYTLNMEILYLTWKAINKLIRSCLCLNQPFYPSGLTLGDLTSYYSPGLQEELYPRRDARKWTLFNMLLKMHNK